MEAVLDISTPNFISVHARIQPHRSSSPRTHGSVCPIAHVIADIVHRLCLSMSPRGNPIRLRSLLFYRSWLDAVPFATLIYVFRSTAPASGCQRRICEQSHRCSRGYSEGRRAYSWVHIHTLSVAVLCPRVAIPLRTTLPLPHLTACRSTAIPIAHRSLILCTS